MSEPIPTHPIPLSEVVSQTLASASAEGLTMTTLAAYARDLSARKGKHLLDALISLIHQKLGEVCDCLVLQLDAKGNPAVVFVVGAETVEGETIELPRADFDRVVGFIRLTPVPLTWMRVTLGPDSSFSSVVMHDLNPDLLDDVQPL